ncbi:zeta toxin family protein [Rathayibacter sp. VKM Ac-2760]|uniref:zeta toxin family protein n=1 Tax=Rathayibacter sp. VKM Ac-2760 TaxID=2609253 RepID=UPI0013179C9B|nr:zeta toxin family protein [Rathayibacter sp. VKM Ac-2760]QHC59388.1 AAA family ATPase [Rathayibacter sp. VKM Ac-2760]
MPVLHLLAGPNGAGKSSYVRDVLMPVTRLPFINADEIAAALWPGEEAEHAYDAARLAEHRRRESLAAGESFVSETVFSHPSKIRLLSDASKAGYLVHLHIVMVPVELSVQRVRERVRRGGHSVPEQKIRDRHERLWAHLRAAVEIADVAEVFDNGSARHPFRLCARFEHGALVGPPQWPRWAPEVLLDV